MVVVVVVVVVVVSELLDEPPHADKAKALATITADKVIERNFNSDLLGEKINAHCRVGFLGRAGSYTFS